jgi:hypothetical protein
MLETQTQQSSLIAGFKYHFDSDFGMHITAASSDKILTHQDFELCPCLTYYGYLNLAYVPFPYFKASGVGKLEHSRIRILELARQKQRGWPALAQPVAPNFRPFPRLPYL